MEKMSRMMPPTPVAAPWYGSTADGWLWLSIRRATARSSPTSMTPAPSPGPDEHPRRFGGETAQMHLGRLVRAMLRPHHRVHRQFELGGVTAEQCDDVAELVVGEAELTVERRFVGHSWIVPADRIPQMRLPYNGKKKPNCRPKESRYAAEEDDRGTQEGARRRSDRRTFGQGVPRRN